MSRKFYFVTVGLCLFVAGCGKQDSRSSGPANTSIQIEGVDPNYGIANTGFNAQPDGQSALSVVGKQIPQGSAIFWNDQPLKTNGGGSQGWVSASVPATLYASPAMVKITVRSPDGTTVSNALDFKIYPVSGPDPQIGELYPPNAAAGKGFNLQPGGDSALGIIGNNFLPGAKVLFGKLELKTGFARGNYLTASVPGTLASRAGDVEVAVVNPDGKTSNKVPFKIGNQ